MLQNHLATLHKKHRDLDTRILREAGRPVQDTGRIKHYKLEKLHLKRTIARLEREHGHMPPH